MSILALWLPVLVSAVVVFFASAAVWMVLKWHDSDFHRTGDEEAVRAALKDSVPGMYTVPYAMTPEERSDPALMQKFEEGPAAFITIVPSGAPTMGGKLVASFIFNVFVGVLCAYMVSRTLAAGASYLEVFRIAGTTAWIAYGVAYLQDGIWFGKPWPSVAKNLLDALIYGLLTGGVFGWLS